MTLLQVLLGCGVIGAWHAADADTCAPSVAVVGSDPVAADVRGGLADRGLAPGNDPHCPSIRATLATDDTGLITIDLVDPAGRKSRREVATPVEAVTVIEAWSRSELTGDLLAGFEPAAAAAPPVMAPLSAEPRVDAGVVAPGRPSVHRRLAIAVTGDVGFDLEAGSWYGATATACGNVAWLCVGATVQTHSASGFANSDSAVLASVELPWQVGGLSIIPGAGIGVGLRTWDMTTGQDQSQGSAVGARAEGRATLSFPLTRRVYFDAVVAADVALSGTSDQEQDTPTAAQPALLFRIGAGLRIGAL